MRILLAVFLAANLYGLEIASNGRARATIVTAEAADREAAAELAGYLRRVTGAALPIGEAAANRILVGAAACAPGIRARLRKLNRDAYVIETQTDGALCLAGNGRDGTAFAVYRFLEEFAGVRWLWPGELGEVVPHRPALSVGKVSIQAEPAFLWRDLGPGGALWGPLDKLAAERKLGVSEQHQKTQKLWERRNRFGGERIYGGHAFGEILPPAKLGPGHPEYFALVNGKRDWRYFDGKHRAQPCTTNPDVIRITAGYARNFFRLHPDYDGFSISLNDGRGFCECGNCRRLDTGRRQNGGLPVITDRIVTFANRVAEALAGTHPDKKLILFAYGQYKEPPERVRVHPNVIIQYTFHAVDNWDPESERRQLAETRAWSGAAKHLGIYEYFVQGNCPDMPRLMLEPVARSVRRLYEQGYRYYQTQAGNGHSVNGLNYYVLARLLWDPAADWKALKADYIESGFGGASAPVKRYFDKLEARWRELRGKPVGMDAATAASYRRLMEAFPRPWREACRKDLADAAALARGVERRRVEFLERGFEYVEMTLDATEKTLPLLESGWKFGREIAAPANARMEDFQAALAAWEKRDRYVESLKEDYVISYVWVRYNDHNRTFNPLERMRTFAATRTEPGRLRRSIRRTLFVPDPLPQLEARTYGRFEPEPGITAERVSYATQYGMRVPAILYLPERRNGRIPAIIIVNGHGGDKYSWYAGYAGVLYARAGAAVLTYDPIGEGERNAEKKSGTRAHDAIPRDRILGRRLGGLMMTDLMQAVSFLRSRPEVDPDRIAAAGYSMGSFVLSLACATETRLKACVLAGGGNLDGYGEYWDSSKPMCQGYPYQSLAFLGDRAAILYRLHAERGPTLVINGLKDPIMQPQRRDPAGFFEQLRARTGMPGRAFETAYIADGGHRPYFVTRQAALWLERTLDFPNWDEPRIRSMAETHVLSWARERGVAMDRLYATELSEGGTRALGEGVPGLRRDQLTVFPEEVWKAHSSDIVLEGWLRRAGAER